MAELYESLPPRTIRLLRVLPGDTEAPIQCDLLLLPLPESSGQLQLYEALSYVWGSEDKPRSILVSGHLVHIGTNLYQALLRLRHRVLDRVLWIDAICINQADTGEKSQQIPLMSQIYHQAGRVIVWLGEEADNSAKALDVIVKAGSDASVKGIEELLPDARNWSEKDSSSDEVISLSDEDIPWTPSSQSSAQSIAHSEGDPHDSQLDDASEIAVSAVLTRPWFRRIWVLQEISSSRYTLMLCGSIEVNAYAFCLGVLALSGLLKQRLGIFGWVMPVVSLMASATLNPNRANLRPLGELVDMYHTRHSTIPHDMLYALQGLCSDNFEDIGIPIDYSEHWDHVFHNLLRVLLPGAPRFYVLGDGVYAGFQHAAKLIGKVITVNNFAQRGGFQEILTEGRANTRAVNDHQTWHIPNSAKSIQIGDFICLFEGNMRPAVVRAQGDYFELIIVAASWKHQGMSRTNWQKVARFGSEFDLLPFVWDWQRHGKVDREDYHQTLLRTVLDLNHLIDPRDISLAQLKRLWDVATAISPLSWPHRGIQATQDSRLEAMEIHSKLYGLSPNDVHKLNEFPLLSWAASHGSYKLARDLLRGGADVNITDHNGRTALSYAAERGDVDLAQYFLENGAQRSRKKYSRSPLYFAMLNRDKKLTQVLLFLLDASEFVQRKAFIRAIRTGNIDLVRLLLSFGFDAKSGLLHYIPPLSEVVANLNIDLAPLLERRISQPGISTLTWPYPRKHCAKHTTLCPLHVATETCNESMVRFLVEHCTNIQGIDWVCPFFCAAIKVEEAILRLLPAPEAGADWRDEHGRTPLHLLTCTPYAYVDRAAAIVRILLGHGIDINATDERGRTPLMWAVASRELRMTDILIHEGADVKCQDKDMQTCLVKAVGYQREESWVEGVEILLKNGVKFEDTDWFYREASKHGKTPAEIWPWCWPRPRAR